MNSAIIYNQDGEIEMIVHPDYEEQLADPAFNPKGKTRVLINQQTYNKCKDYYDILKATLQDVPAQLKSILTDKIQQEDARVAQELLDEAVAAIAVP